MDPTNRLQTQSGDLPDDGGSETSGMPLVRIVLRLLATVAVAVALGAPFAGPGGHSNWSRSRRRIRS